MLVLLQSFRSKQALSPSIRKQGRSYQAVASFNLIPLPIRHDFSTNEKCDKTLIFKKLFARVSRQWRFNRKGRVHPHTTKTDRWQPPFPFLSLGGAEGGAKGVSPVTAIRGLISWLVSGLIRSRPRGLYAFAICSPCFWVCFFRKSQPQGPQLPCLLIKSERDTVSLLCFTEWYWTSRFSLRKLSSPPCALLLFLG